MGRYRHPVDVPGVHLRTLALRVVKAARPPAPVTRRAVVFLGPPLSCVRRHAGGVVLAVAHRLLFVCESARISLRLSPRPLAPCPRRRASLRAAAVSRHFPAGWSCVSGTRAAWWRCPFSACFGAPSLPGSSAKDALRRRRVSSTSIYCR